MSANRRHLKTSPRSECIFTPDNRRIGAVVGFSNIRVLTRFSPKQNLRTTAATPVLVRQQRDSSTMTKR